MISRLLKTTAVAKTASSAPAQLQLHAGNKAEYPGQNVPLQHYAESIVSSLNVGLIITDKALFVLSANDCICNILGLEDTRQITGQHLRTLLPALESPQVLHPFLSGKSGKRYLSIPYEQRHLRITLTEIIGKHAQQHLLITVEDITDEHRLREETLANAAHHRNQASLLDKASDAIIVIGINHHISYWNKAAEKLYGWTCAEALGSSPENLLWDDEAAFNEVTRQTIENGEWRGEISQRRKDGRPFIVESQRTLVRDESQRPKSILIINTDITERKANEERIRHLALYDSLTGLPNRTLFMDRLRQAISNARRYQRQLAILFLDLDRFKEINDTQGHDVGDQVLMQVAQRFEATLRGEKTLARLGGDEFIVVTEVEDQVAAAMIAERLQQTLTTPLCIGDDHFSVGVSIGLSFYPEDGNNADDLMKCADIAMYKAKTTGAGYIAYQARMSADLNEQMHIARNLHQAMNADKLELHYQPKINLKTGEIDGAEALLRWNDAERGWISPAQFIPIAEARGMMAQLGLWVLEQACRQICAWQAAGYRFHGRLAINLSAQQLSDPELADKILQTVLAAGLSPACIELELTESSLMHNVAQSIDIMKSLKLMGFALSIDDFGTGYSSLSYLKCFPVDTLKIDISFIRDMLNEHQGHAIVTTIIGMARNLGLKAIAEGVETQAQATSLRELNCDHAQGYYFGRPEPAQIFALTWLRCSADTA
ncbi:MULTISPECIES: putative bifunctional diguanylate cyclase/phosphodiesterase [unclassified Undibacterium]|uniref:putative bifunctional diguanylate cyclase/phosphodiesterase n=1 Tax=unclassified Undibacterium TaxID=2630295 RepID=UPI003C2F688A